MFFGLKACRKRAQTDIIALKILRGFANVELQKRT